MKKCSFFEGFKVSQKHVEGTEEVFHKKCRILFVETRPNSQPGSLCRNINEII